MSQPPETTPEDLEDVGVVVDRSNLTPRHGLTDEDQAFCHALMFSNMKPGRAYVEAYGDPAIQGKRTPAATLARDKLRTAKISRYLDWCGQDEFQLAESIDREMLVLGNPQQRLAAAARVEKRRAERESTNPVDRYMQVIAEEGAELVKPVPKGTQEATVSLSDLLGKGFIRLGPKAMTGLLHRAGAPWNEHDSTWTLSDLQLEILSRRERTVIVHGGSGVGKSVAGACLGLAELCVPGTRTAIIGATYDLASSEFQYIYEGFLKLFGPSAAKRCVCRNTKTQHDMEISTHWGSSVIAFSLDRDNGGQMYGREFDLVVLCEASRIDADTYLRAVVRATNRRMKKIYVCPDDCEERPRVGAQCSNADHAYVRETGRTSMFTTPQGFDGAPASVYETTQKRTERHPERVEYGQVSYAESVWIREADCLENPSYSEAAYASAQATLPPDIFDEQYRGLMVRRSGLIYKEFIPDRNLLLRPSWEDVRRMRLGVGIDTGKHFAAVMVGIAPDRKKWVLGEVYESEHTTANNVLDVMRMVNEVVGQAWGQGEEKWNGGTDDEKVREIFRWLGPGVDVWRHDPASQVAIDMVDQFGDDIGLIYDDLEVLGSISQCRTWFEQGELLIARDPFESGEPVSPWLVWELGRYRWKLVPEKRGDHASKLAPEKSDDHACDALRYICVPLDEFGPMEETDTAILTAEEAYQKAMHDPITSWKKAAERATHGKFGTEYPPGMAGFYHRMQ